MKIIIVNGYPESGKDTFIKYCMEYLGKEKHLNSVSLSSIDQVKQAATFLGWDGVKDEKSRLILSKLKDLSTEFFDGPFLYIKDKIECYEQYTFHDFVFVQIREPDEIKKLVNFLKEKGKFVKTIYINNRRISKEKVYNNHADSNVELYEYDYYIYNLGTLEDLRTTANKFIDDICKIKPKKSPVKSSPFWNKICSWLTLGDIRDV